MNCHFVSNPIIYAISRSYLKVVVALAQPLTCNLCIICIYLKIKSRFRRQLWSQCERSNPNSELAASFGYGQMMGAYDGGQAEYVRVPFANTNPLKIPDDLSEEQALFLSDILPTGYFGADIANVQPGDVSRCLVMALILQERGIASILFHSSSIRLGGEKYEVYRS
jgi:hypothetical protein